VNALLTAPSRAMNGALSQTSVARPTAARRLSASKLKSDERQRAVSILREWACHRHRLRRSGVPIHKFSVPLHPSFRVLLALVS